MPGRRLRWRREGSKTIAGDQSCHGEGGAGNARPAGSLRARRGGLGRGCRGMMYTRALRRPLDNTPLPGRGVARTRVCVCRSVRVCVRRCVGRAPLCMPRVPAFLLITAPRTRLARESSTRRGRIRTLCTHTHTHTYNMYIYVLPSVYNIHTVSREMCVLLLYVIPLHLKTVLVRELLFVITYNNIVVLPRHVGSPLQTLRLFRRLGAMFLWFSSNY